MCVAAPEYGVLSHLFTFAGRLFAKAPIVGGLVRMDQEKSAKAAAEAAANAQGGATAVDRIESRQLELQEKVVLILEALGLESATVTKRQQGAGPEDDDAAREVDGASFGGELPASLPASPSTIFQKMLEGQSQEGVRLQRLEQMLELLRQEQGSVVGRAAAGQASARPPRSRTRTKTRLRNGGSPDTGSHGSGRVSAGVPVAGVPASGAPTDGTAGSSEIDATILLAQMRAAERQEMMEA